MGKGKRSSNTTADIRYIEERFLRIQQLCCKPYNLKRLGSTYRGCEDPIAMQGSTVLAYRLPFEGFNIL